jgi:hypothetical protein
MIDALKRVLALAFLACLTGCEVVISTSDTAPEGAPVVLAGNRPVEIPVCNLPLPLRVRNYKGGSCVHASTGSDFNWLNLFTLQRYWNSTYSGGESYSGLVSKLRRNNIPFYETHAGDVAVLERCTRERRMATIFYYSNHSVNFNGFGDEVVRWDGTLCHVPSTSGAYAYLLDNNRVGAFIQIPRDEFIRKWRGYGGVAVIPSLGAPAPPLPYVARN